MTSPEQLNTPENKEAGFTLNELKSLIDSHRENKDKLLTVPNINFAQEANKLEASFVDELISKKDKFSKIFKTSQGSVYFILQSGESLRAKNKVNTKDQSNYYKFEPILENIFFIPQQVAEEIDMSRLRYSKITEFELCDFEVGAVPLELNIHRFSDRILFSVEGNKLKITGSEFIGGEVPVPNEQIVGGIHLGHPITEIIK